jgi:hypothetical protein
MGISNHIKMDKSLQKSSAFNIEIYITFVEEVYCFIETNLSRKCGDIWLICEVCFLVEKLVLCEERLEKGLTVTQCYLSARSSIDPVRYKSWKHQGLTSSLPVLSPFIVVCSLNWTANPQISTEAC